MNIKPISEVKPGERVRLIEHFEVSRRVYTRGAYSHADRAFVLKHEADIYKSKLAKGWALVAVNFDA
jgi:hypothetical protein